MSVESRFLGIDVTAGNRPYAYAVVENALVGQQPGEWITGITELGWIEAGPDSVDNVIRLVGRVKPQAVAIDCPSGLPQGLSVACCLAEPATCQHQMTGVWRNRVQTMRIAEHEVRALGIKLYFTNKNSCPSWKELVVSIYTYVGST